MNEDTLHKVNSPQSDEQFPPKPKPVDKPPKNIGVSIISYLMEIIQILIIVGVLSFVIRIFIVQPFYIIGSSMENYLHEGELLLIDELSYRFTAPNRGDIVVIKPPRDTRDYIKRIIGLPGETIKIDDKGEVLINDNVLNEPYLSQQNKITKGQLNLTLGKDDYFVLGDNRSVSNDSRGTINLLTNQALDPWTIHKKDIVGRAFLRWWPLNKFTFIQHSKYK
jgi:signal peptidase I